MTINMFAMLEQVTRLVEEDKPDEAYRVVKDSVNEDKHGFARLFLAAWINHLAQEEETEQSKFAEILICLKEDFPELTTIFEQEAVEPEPVSTMPAMPLWLAPFEKPRLTSPVADVVASEPAVEADKAESATAEEAAAPEPEAAVPDVSVEESADAESQAEEPAISSGTKAEQETETAPPSPEAPEAVQEPEELENLTLTFYEWQMSAIRKAAQKEQVHEGALLTRMLETRKLEPLMWSRYRHGSTSSPTQRITIAVPHETKVTIEKDKDFEGIKTTTKYVRRVLFGARAEKA